MDHACVCFVLLFAECGAFLAGFWGGVFFVTGFSFGSVLTGSLVVGTVSLGAGRP